MPIIFTEDSIMVKYFAIALILIVGVNRVAPTETLRSITGSFLKVLEECRKELTIGDNVLADMYYFWKQDRALMHRDTGCAIVCMSQKLNLLDDSGKLHHGNAHEFALRHGAADDMAAKLVSTVHACEEQHLSEEDKCLRALEVAKCFKTAMHEINWAPKVDVVITEILTEV
ncbi:unnamed protein product, partial [Brenthis ino]